MDTAEQILPDRIIDDLQEADKNIVKITEIVLVLRSTKQKLNSIETRTPEEEIRLAHVNEELDRRLKELDEQFELVNQALTKMQEHTQTMICNQNANTTCDNGTSNAICCGSTEDLKKVVILNWDKKKEKPPQIMVLKSTDNCAEAVCGNDRSNCSLFSVCETDNDVKSCCCQSSSDICEKSDESVQEDESMNAQMKSKICILNEQLENILNKNQNVRLKLKNAIQQNDLMEEALKRPAPFKYSATEGVRFPGKKEMEEKLFALKSIIMSLSNEFRKVQINQAKLKLAREIIEKYNEKLIICVCNKTPYNINTDTYIKVKKQEIKQIALQNKAINNELNNIIFDQNCAIQNNLKTVSEINKLEKALMDKKRKIEEYDVDNNEDVTTQLNKTNEEIETMELLIQERKQLLFDCNEKFTEVELETKEITYQTQELEDLVKQLSSNYHYNYDNLKSCYKEQLEEMVALPIVLKATHIKLQQETDLRVLAEENRDQLEREIKQVEAENMKSPIKNEDLNEKIEKLDNQNKEIESNINTMLESIKLVTANVDQDSQELDAVNKLVLNAVIESDQHINAFKNFSKIHLDKITGDLKAIEELLIELQSKECEKSIVRKTVMDHLKTQLYSTNSNVEMCMKEMNSIKDQTDC